MDRFRHILTPLYLGLFVVCLLGAPVCANETGAVTDDECPQIIAGRTDTRIVPKEELLQIFEQGTAAVDAQLFSLTPAALAQTMDQLSGSEFALLLQQHAETFAYFQRKRERLDSFAAQQQVAAPTPVVAATPTVTIDRSWEWSLVYEALNGGHRELGKYLGSVASTPAELVGTLTALSADQQKLRSQVWIPSKASPVSWSPIFYNLKWLQEKGCNTPEKWALRADCRAMLMNLYGALTEAWLVKPAQEGFIPGAAIRVGGKHHADGWRYSTHNGNFVINGFVEVKPSILGFHEKGMYQVHGFLKRLLDPEAAIQIFGYEVPRDKIIIQTKGGQATLAALAATLPAGIFNVSGPSNGIPAIAFDEAKWRTFVAAYEQVFDEKFYEVVLPSDEVAFIPRLKDAFGRPIVGIQTEGLLTLPQNRLHFVEFLMGVFGVTADRHVVRSSLFKQEIHNRKARVLVPLGGDAVDWEAEEAKLADVDPRIRQNDYCGVVGDGDQFENCYEPLGRPEHAEKKKFLEEVWLPYTGWAGVLIAPGRYRQITVDKDSLTVESYEEGKAKSVRFEWVAAGTIDAPEWVETTEAYVLRIPRGYEWPNQARVAPFFDYGLVGHDLQRFNDVDWIERRRVAFGERRMLQKGGQRYILKYFRDALDAKPNDAHKIFVLGPPAYGKTFALTEAVKEVARRDEASLRQEPPAESVHRNLSLVVATEKRVLGQISHELNRSRSLGVSTLPDARQIRWETDAAKNEVPDLKTLIQIAKSERRSVVVTVNWDHLNDQIEKAEESDREELRKLMRGLYIDRADEVSQKKPATSSGEPQDNYRTVELLCNNNPRTILWGQDSVSLHRDVVRELFDSHVVSVLGDSVGAGSPEVIAVRQIHRAVDLGVVTPIRRQDDRRMLIHYTVDAALSQCLTGSGIDPKLLYKSITDEGTRTSVYNCFGRVIQDFALRNRTIIRVQYQKQAKDIAEFLQGYFDELSRQESKPQRRVRAFYSGCSGEESVYQGMQTEDPETRVDIAVVAKKFDGGLSAPLFSGVIFATETVQPEVFIRVMGSVMPLHPGKRQIELMQISAEASLSETVLAQLERKASRLEREGGTGFQTGTGDTASDSSVGRITDTGPRPLTEREQAERKRRDDAHSLALFPVGELPSLRGDVRQNALAALVRVVLSESNKVRQDHVRNRCENHFKKEDERATCRRLASAVHDLRMEDVTTRFAALLGEPNPVTDVLSNGLDLSGKTKALELLVPAIGDIELTGELPANWSEVKPATETDAFLERLLGYLPGDRTAYLTKLAQIEKDVFGDTDSLVDFKRFHDVLGPELVTALSPYRRLGELPASFSEDFVPMDAEHRAKVVEERPVLESEMKKRITAITGASQWNPNGSAGGNELPALLTHVRTHLVTLPLHCERAKFRATLDKPTDLKETVAAGDSDLNNLFGILQKLYPSDPMLQKLQTRCLALKWDTTASGLELRRQCVTAMKSYAITTYPELRVIVSNKIGPSSIALGDIRRLGAEGIGVAEIERQGKAAVARATSLKRAYISRGSKDAIRTGHVENLKRLQALGWMTLPPGWEANPYDAVEDHGNALVQTAGHYYRAQTFPWMNYIEIRPRVAGVTLTKPDPAPPTVATTGGTTVTGGAASAGESPISGVTGTATKPGTGNTEDGATATGTDRGGEETTRRREPVSTASFPRPEAKPRSGDPKPPAASKANSEDKATAVPLLFAKLHAELHKATFARVKTYMPTDSKQQGAFFSRWRVVHLIKLRQLAAQFKKLFGNENQISIDIENYISMVAGIPANKANADTFREIHSTASQLTESLPSRCPSLFGFRVTPKDDWPALAAPKSSNLLDRFLTKILGYTPKKTGRMGMDGKIVSPVTGDRPRLVPIADLELGDEIIEPAEEHFDITFPEGDWVAGTEVLSDAYIKKRQAQFPLSRSKARSRVGRVASTDWPFEIDKSDPSRGWSQCTRGLFEMSRALEFEWHRLYKRLTQLNTGEQPGPELGALWLGIRQSILRIVGAYEVLTGNSDPYFSALGKLLKDDTYGGNSMKLWATLAGLRGYVARVYPNLHDEAYTWSNYAIGAFELDRTEAQSVIGNCQAFEDKIAELEKKLEDGDFDWAGAGAELDAIALKLRAFHIGLAPQVPLAQRLVSEDGRKELLAELKKDVSEGRKYLEHYWQSDQPLPWVGLVQMTNAPDSVLSVSAPQGGAASKVAEVKLPVPDPHPLETDDIQRYGGAQKREALLHLIRSLDSELREERIKEVRAGWRAADGKPAKRTFLNAWIIMLKLRLTELSRGFEILLGETNVISVNINTNTAKLRKITGDPSGDYETLIAIMENLRFSLGILCPVLVTDVRVTPLDPQPTIKKPKFESALVNDTLAVFLGHEADMDDVQHTYMGWFYDLEAAQVQTGGAVVNDIRHVAEVLGPELSQSAQTRYDVEGPDDLIQRMHVITQAFWDNKVQLPLSPEQAKTWAEAVVGNIPDATKILISGVNSLQYQLAHLRAEIARVQFRLKDQEAKKKVKRPIVDAIEQKLKQVISIARDQFRGDKYLSEVLKVITEHPITGGLEDRTFKYQVVADAVAEYLERYGVPSVSLVTPGGVATGEEDYWNLDIATVNTTIQQIKSLLPQLEGQLSVADSPIHIHQNLREYIEQRVTIYKDKDRYLVIPNNPSGSSLRATIKDLKERVAEFERYRDSNQFLSPSCLANPPENPEVVIYVPQMGRPISELGALKDGDLNKARWDILSYLLWEVNASNHNTIKSEWDSLPGDPEKAELMGRWCRYRSRRVGYIIESAEAVFGKDSRLLAVAKAYQSGLRDVESPDEWAKLSTTFYYELRALFANAFSFSRAAGNVLAAPAVRSATGSSATDRFLRLYGFSHEKPEEGLLEEFEKLPASVILPYRTIVSAGNTSANIIGVTPEHQEAQRKVIPYDPDNYPETLERFLEAYKTTAAYKGETDGQIVGNKLRQLRLTLARLEFEAQRIKIRGQNECKPIIERTLKGLKDQLELVAGSFPEDAYFGRLRMYVVGMQDTFGDATKFGQENFAAAFHGLAVVVGGYIDVTYPRGGLETESVFPFGAFVAAHAAPLGESAISTQLLSARTAIMGATSRDEVLAGLAKITCLDAEKWKDVLRDDNGAQALALEYVAELEEYDALYYKASNQDTLTERNFIMPIGRVNPSDFVQGDVVVVEADPDEEEEVTIAKRLFIAIAPERADKILEKFKADHFGSGQEQRMLREWWTGQKVMLRNASNQFKQRYGDKNLLSGFLDAKIQELDDMEPKARLESFPTFCRSAQFSIAKICPALGQITYQTPPRSGADYEAPIAVPDNIGIAMYAVENRGRDPFPRTLVAVRSNVAAAMAKKLHIVDGKSFFEGAGTDGERPEIRLAGAAVENLSSVLGAADPRRQWVELAGLAISKLTQSIYQAERLERQYTKRSRSIDDEDFRYAFEAVHREAVHALEILDVLFSRDERFAGWLKFIHEYTSEKLTYKRLYEFVGHLTFYLSSVESLYPEIELDLKPTGEYASVPNGEPNTDSDVAREYWDGKKAMKAVPMTGKAPDASKLFLTDERSFVRLKELINKYRTLLVHPGLAQVSGIPAHLEKVRVASIELSKALGGSLLIENLTSEIVVNDENNTVEAIKMELKYLWYQVVAMCPVLHQDLRAVTADRLFPALVPLTEGYLIGQREEWPVTDKKVLKGRFNKALAQNPQWKKFDSIAEGEDTKVPEADEFLTQEGDGIFRQVDGAFSLVIQELQSLHYQCTNWLAFREADGVRDFGGAEKLLPEIREALIRVAWTLMELVPSDKPYYEGFATWIDDNIDADDRGEILRLAHVPVALMMRLRLLVPPLEQKVCEIRPPFVGLNTVWFTLSGPDPRAVVAFYDSYQQMIEDDITAMGDATEPITTVEDVKRELADSKFLPEALKMGRLAGAPEEQGGGNEFRARYKQAKEALEIFRAGKALVAPEYVVKEVNAADWGKMFGTAGGFAQGTVGPSVEDMLGLGGNADWSGTTQPALPSEAKAQTLELVKRLHVEISDVRVQQLKDHIKDADDNGSNVTMGWTVVNSDAIGDIRKGLSDNLGEKHPVVLAVGAYSSAVTGQPSSMRDADEFVELLEKEITKLRAALKAACPELGRVTLRFNLDNVDFDKLPRRKQMGSAFQQGMLPGLSGPEAGLIGQIVGANMGNSLGPKMSAWLDSPYVEMLAPTDLYEKLKAVRVE